jgi:hypothetical protein
LNGKSVPVEIGYRRRSFVSYDLVSVQYISKMTYRVRPNGVIETDDIEEAVRLSRILSNAPERTRATEQEIIETVKRFFDGQRFTSKQLAVKLGFDSGTAVREGLRLLYNKKLVKRYRNNDGTSFVWELAK